jgi:ribosome-associated heat shock protein Hsp15
MTAADAPGSQRLDVWLWCARFLRQRAACAALAASGLVRINRQPTDKPHARLRPGDVLTLPLRGQVRVIEVLALAERRGDPASAAALYREVPEAPSEHAAAHHDPCGTGRSAPYPAP